MRRALIATGTIAGALWIAPAVATAQTAPPPTTVEVGTTQVTRTSQVTRNTRDVSEVDTDGDDDSDKTGLWGLLGLLGLAGLAGLAGRKRGQQDGSPYAPRTTGPPPTGATKASSE